MMRNLIVSLTVTTSTAAFAQAPPPQMPAEYAAVLQTLGRQDDYKDNVLKVNIARSDLKVTVDGIATLTPFGFGGWIALTKGDGGMDVMMGDLVLTEAEVNPVMSAVLDNGLEVTALHNHFFYDTPRMFYMHVHGHGATADLAKTIGTPGEQNGAVYKITIGRSDFTTPNISFLHYWGKGPAAKLASGVKAAVAQLAGPRR